MVCLLLWAKSALLSEPRFSRLFKTTLESGIVSLLHASNPALKYRRHFYRWTFIVAAIFGLLGILLAHFFLPDMTGVDMTLEDKKFMQYIANNGWEGEVGIREEIIALEEADEASSRTIKREDRDMHVV